MGWAGGSQTAEQLYESLKPFIKRDCIQKAARKIYDDFCDEDADDWNPQSKLIKDAGVNLEE